MKITQGPIGRKSEAYRAPGIRQRVMDTIWILSELGKEEVQTREEGRMIRIKRPRFDTLMGLYQKAFNRYPQVRYALYTDHVTISWGIDGLFDNMKPGVGFYKIEDLFQ